MSRNFTITARWCILACSIAGSACAGPFEDGKTAFDSGDYQTALRDWRPLAAKGVAGAQFGLGIMYANGNGVAPDYRTAASWFRKAAEQNYAAAQFELGRLYVNGHGVAKDYTAALNWFRTAANQGYADGQFALGVMYENGQGVVQDQCQWPRSGIEAPPSRATPPPNSRSASFTTRARAWRRTSLPRLCG